MARKNERRIESLVEAALRRGKFAEDAKEFQGSNDELVAALLPSKRTGTPGRGRPEFILKLTQPKALVVIEVKDGADLHTSLGPDDDPNTCALKAAKYAEDGVIHYMRGERDRFPGLRDEHLVLGLAVSAGPGATTARDLKVTAFRAARRGPVERVPGVRSIPSLAKAQAILEGERGAPLDAVGLRKFAADLHDFLRDEMELSKDEKPLLVSAILLALNTDFRKTYYNISDPGELADLAYQFIEGYLKRVKLAEDKRVAMLETYRLLKSNADVRLHLPRAVAMLDRHLGRYVASGDISRDSFDVMGHFYREFLRYTGGDKQNLGIVLTPHHVCELFVDLKRPDPARDVVIDVCAGTGGFLVAAMASMLGRSDGDAKVEKRIKSAGIGGIEKRANLFTVTCANMILRGDGKANIYQGDAIEDDDAIARLQKLRPTLALLNPPYSKAKTTQHEFAFVQRSLDTLERDGTCIALLPMSLATATDAGTTEWKRRLLAEHTLLAVMSLPDQLFPGVGVVTCAMVFQAKRPHAGAPTWLALWKDDGFRLRKGDRVEVAPGRWGEVKAAWLDAYRARAERVGSSALRVVTERDEWCAERYLEPDYSRITPEVMAVALQRYALHQLSLQVEAAGAAAGEPGAEADALDLDATALEAAGDGDGPPPDDTDHTSALLAADADAPGDGGPGAGVGSASASAGAPDARGGDDAAAL